MEDFYSDPILSEKWPSQVSPKALPFCTDPSLSQRDGMARIIRMAKRIQKQKRCGISEQHLKEHDQAIRSGQISDMSPNLEWFMSVKSKSDDVRAQTLDAMGGHLLSTVSCPNIATHVASFVGGDCTSDREQASIAEEDVPDGHHVRGCRIIQRDVMIGEGRPGFIIDFDAEISSPRGTSLSANHWDADLHP